MKKFIKVCIYAHIVLGMTSIALANSSITSIKDAIYAFVLGPFLLETLGLLQIMELLRMGLERVL